MKENVLDVLMYLFEHYLDEESDIEVDKDSLKDELTRAGFPEVEISKAFAWLEGLTVQQDTPARALRNNPADRIYTSWEQERLDLQCRGFLIFLEQVGVLDSVTRELVLDRVMALETEDLDLDQLKWVVLMVLFNQPGKEAVYAWMEDLVFDNASGLLH